MHDRQHLCRFRLLAKNRVDSLFLFPSSTQRLSRHRNTLRCSLLFVVMTAILGTVTGCPVTSLPSASISGQAARLAAEDPVADGAAPPALTERERLAQRIDAVLEANLRNRRLSTDVHAAWQIMHGVLAYGPAFKVQSGGREVSALELVLRGGPINGLELRSGDRFSTQREPASLSGNPASDVELDPLLTRGIRVEVDPGAKRGQGHRDQWLAYLVSCSLPIDQIFQTMDGPRRLDLWLRQMEWDVPMNFEREYSWTLMSLLPYRATTHRWTARDGKDYSIESLLRSEIDQLSPDSACGGSHRLTAIATAVNKRKAEGAAISGVWDDAQSLVDMAILQAIEWQNADGSFSSEYFEREGWSIDVASAIGTTGHTLEFIATGGSDEQLSSKETVLAVNCLCRMLEQTSEVDLECGALYHALSGLQRYRKRLAP